MRLSTLIGANGDAAKIDILGLTADSRAVKPGYLFAALPGTKVKGSDFIDDAIGSGAVAVLADGEAVIDPAKAYPITDPNPRRRLAKMAAAFYNAQPDTVVAVTGTNGKSSVADFVRQIWAALGLKAGTMGTLGVVTEDGASEPSLTTPDPVEVHARLAALKEAGIDHLALEASSHGLAQYRLDGVRLSAAAFTNLSRDHPDYHKTYDDYFHAKLRLFGDLLPPGATAVLNTETHVYEELSDICWGRGLRIITVGTGGDLAITARTRRPGGQSLTLSCQGAVRDIELPLIGDFQASNALVAAGLVIATGGEAEAVLSALPTLKPVPGRMEWAGQLANGASVYIDYAHTPDALRTLLETLRPYTEGKLHVVFGAGGDRDEGKRPLMGEVAAKLADYVTVADDNPRSEDPASIRRAIIDACPGAIDIGDRGEAIEAGIAALGPGDVLAVAGKGHETGQVIGDQILPFSDAEAITQAIAVREGGDG